MKLHITKHDLANMIRGCSPDYDSFNHPLIKSIGSYTGGHVEKWQWNYKFEDRLSEEQLLEVYLLCNKQAFVEEYNHEDLAMEAMNTSYKYK